MSIAYLILAHKNPVQLLRLVNSIHTEEDYFVIHIDKSCSIASFEKLFTEQKNVIFMTERCRSIWGSYEQVQATLNGLRLIKNIPNVERIVILSGQDYPIKKLSYIKDFFIEHPSNIFMECTSIPVEEWYYGGSWRFPSYSSVKESMELYGGSQWISFPCDIIQIIFDFLALNPLFELYFESVFIPSESFFQTLLMNCGIDEIITKIVSENLHLIDRSKQPDHTWNFVDSELKLILDSEKLFARKFEIESSSEILRYIDKNILELQTKPDDAENFSSILAPGKKQLISFLTNKSSSEVINHYNNLRAQVGDLGDTRMFFHHDPQSQINPVVQGTEPYFFTSNILTELGYNSLLDSSIDGSNHFPLLKFFKEHPNYDYYWYIEDDVHCLMGWDNFFKIFLTENINTDFISSHVRDHAEEPGWFWWNTIVFKSNHLPDHLKVRSFNPLFRISNNALRFVDQCLALGWEGHFEVLLPSLLKMGGFSIAEFGGVGKYVIPGCENRFYTAASEDQTGEIGTGSMRYRPVISREEMILPMIYHPVKSINQK